MPLPETQLEAFMAVAELSSFTKAANKLHITQSALSQRIINLEEALQVTLFLRERAGLRLTEEAMELLRYCQTKNHLEDEALGKIKYKDKQGVAGTLRIGGFSSVMRSVIQPSLTTLLLQNANIKYGFITRDLSDLPDLLKRGEIDYMISYENENHEREELEHIHLGFEQNVLLKHKKYAGPEIYLDHNIHDVTTMNYLKLAKTNRKDVQRRYLDDIYGLIDGVRAGLGLAVLPKHLLNGFPEIEIVNPKLVFKIPVSLYFYRRTHYSRLHQELVTQLVAGCKKILSH